MIALDDRLKALAKRPGAGRPRDELGPGLRSTLIGSHLVIYRSVADGIEIARVLHASMDIPAQFRDE